MGQGSTRLNNPSPPEEIIIIGRVGAPFGVKGWVHIHSFVEEPQTLFNYSTWQIKSPTFLSPLQPIKPLKSQQTEPHPHLNPANQMDPLCWQPYTVQDWKPHGKNYVALLAGCTTRDDAQTLTNKEIGIPKSQLPKLPDHEYYWAELIGLLVVTESGDILGRVDSLLETGANDVLVVRNEMNEKSKKKEHLLPYVPDEYILKIDLAKKEMVVRWDPEF